MKKRQLMLFSTIILCTISFAEKIPNEKLYIWGKAPIEVNLPIDQEVMVTFRESVTFENDDPLLTVDKLRVQNSAGTLYLTAHETFSKKRVLVKTNTTGKVVLLDLTSRPGSQKNNVRIKLVSDDHETSKEEVPQSHSSIDFVELMRFAIQQLYSPVRLQEIDSSAYRIPMHTSKTVTLFYDNSIIAMPLISWHSKNAIITAVLLRNNTQRENVLNPVMMRGNWRAISFYPNTQLEKQGTELDTTTAFLISNKPFNESIGSD